jgi:predicted metal-dependent phosphoesterase TrpH
MSEGEATIRVDPHVHSRASYDGHDSVDRILAHAKEIGLDAVAITDHDTIEASLRAAALAPSYGLIGIPGVEISTCDGHLLGLGIETMPEPGRSFESTVQAIRARDGVAIVPHPFQRIRHGVKKRNLTECDAIEVYNAWLLTGYRNRRARTFATRRGYPGVAGSDAHSILTLGRAYTEIEFDENRKRDIDSTTIVAAIRNGTLDVHGRRAPIHRSAGHYLKGAGRKTISLTRAVPTRLANMI